MRATFSISLKTKAVLPHDVGPATMAVNGCTKVIMSSEAATVMMLYLYLSLLLSPSRGVGRSVRAIHYRKSQSPKHYTDASCECSG